MALAYLLDPSFQFVNENGRPLVGGRIEVYYHNSHWKYITKADFNGTNNPFEVPLNSKGMAVIIAESSNIYDIYCYDAFNALYWSRENVTTIGNVGDVNITDSETLEFTKSIFGNDVTFNGSVRDFSIGSDKLIDGSITEAKLNASLIASRLRYKYLNGVTDLTLQNGDFVYDNCTINTISSETILTGNHIFINCTLGDLFIKNGKYDFYNCTFGSLRFVGSTARVYGSVGNHLTFTGACHNSVVEACYLTENGRCPLEFSGSVANNVTIRRNKITNNRASGSVVELQCINTHGVTNSIIEQNVLICPYNRNILDISGHGAYIRAENVVVRGNYIPVGGIVIYAAKDCILSNNVVGSMTFNGEFLADTDYGFIRVVGNYIFNQMQIRINSGTPYWKIFISGNTAGGGTSTFFRTDYDFDGDRVKVYLLGNVVYKALCQKNNYAKKLILPITRVFVPSGQKYNFPPCYVKTSELGAYGLPAGSYYSGWTSVNNTSGVDRYADICIIESQEFWTQK